MHKTYITEIQDLSFEKEFSEVREEIKELVLFI